MWTYGNTSSKNQLFTRNTKMLATYLEGGIMA